MAEPGTVDKENSKMIILLYLIVILGWALLILVIKCRKAREKRLALAQQEAQTQSAVHVIQIGNSFYDVIPITNPSASAARCHHHSHCQRGFHIRHSASNSNLDVNSHTNPTFVLDEGVYPSAPPPGFEAPPSYDEVIRLPNQYPKLTSSTSVTPINENPPTIAEIEANGHSITTLTSSSPAVIMSQSRSHSHQATTVT